MRTVFASLCIFAIAASHPGVARADTTVPAGTMNADQEWTASGSPYLIGGDVTVLPGVTLTIRQGVTVRFATTDSQGSGEDSGRCELRIEGSLITSGTAAEPVAFESAAASPAAGDYHGLVLLAGCSASMQASLVRHAVYGIHAIGANTVDVADCELTECTSGAYIDGSPAALSGGSVHDNSSHGVQIRTDSAALLSGTVVRDNGSYGVYALNAYPTIAYCRIHDNGSRGVYVNNTTSTARSVTVENNTIVWNSSDGVYFDVDSGSLSATLRDNIIASNSGYGVRSSYASVSASYNLIWGHGTDYSGVTAGTGSMSENPLFVDEAGRDLDITHRSPARLHASDGADMGALAWAVRQEQTPFLAGHLYADLELGAAGSPHEVLGDLTVEPGILLSITPGAELRFAAGSDVMGGNADVGLAELRVLGALQADGTASTHVALRSGAASPARGDWYGVHLLAGSGPSRIDHAELRHARYGIHCLADAGTSVQRSILEQCASYGLFIEGDSQASFDELAIRGNASYGVYARNASPSLSDSLVYDNGSRGVYVHNTTSTGHQTALTGNTIVWNGSDGVYFDVDSGSLSATLRDNIIANNSGYGARSSYASVSATYNLIWGHGTDYSGVTAGTGSMSENPLFVDELGRDFDLTHRSPARLHASDGLDMGALAWAVRQEQTPFLAGHIYEDLILGAGSPHAIPGDLTVESGVKLEIQAGAELMHAAGSDVMGGNTDRNRTELRVLGRLVVAGTAPDPVQLVSDSPTPSRGDWYGLHLLPGAGSSAISRAVVHHAYYGIWSEADETNAISGGEVSECASYGIYLSSDSRIRLDGPVVHHNASHGVYVLNASPLLHNTVSHHNGSRGIYVHNTTSTAHAIEIQHASAGDNSSDGLYADVDSGSMSVTLRNSIIAGNAGYGLRSSYASFSSNYNDVWGQTTNYSGVTAGGSDRSENPQFVDTDLGNYHLLVTSPCIDVADPLSPLSSDAEGVVRPLDGNSSGSDEPDMGAYEFNPSANRWPIADAGTDQVIELNVPATFDASGSFDPDGTIISYHWDFGDGHSDDGMVVQHAFADGTDRTVTLTVTDDDNAIDIDTVFVEVNLPPVADAGAASVYEDVGVDIPFNGSASHDPDGSVVRWDWDFGNGDRASGQAVEYQYPSSGDYTVTLTVTDDDGSTDNDTLVAHILGSVDTQPPTIVHVPVADGQPESQAVQISAEVTDNMGLDIVSLFYRPQGESAFSAVEMTSTGGDTYAASIPADVVRLPRVDYYIYARDTATTANLATHPDGAPTFFHSFTVEDATAPTIDHTPIGNGQPEGQAVAVSATISDPSGIDSATLYYRRQGAGSFQSLPMSGAGDTRSASIPAAAVAAPGVDYYILALDGSPRRNQAAHPAGAPASFHSFSVQVGDGSPPAITHSPIADGQIEGQAVWVSATITDSSGVASAALYYRTQGGGLFASLPMTANDDIYSAEIPASAVQRPGVEYYIEATDGASPANTGYHPADAPSTVHVFSVVREFAVSEGDLVISEIMTNPAAVSDSVGEWFEIHNPTGADIDIEGFTFADNDDESFTVQGGPVIVAAGGYLVLGRSDDLQANGGVSVDYVYSGFLLANNIDEIVIWAGGAEIDRVEYDATSFPLGSGASTSLSPDRLDHLSNDDGESWCAATSPLTGGDLGTPGAANDACGPDEDLDPPVIVHTPVSSGQPESQPVSLSAVVSDGSGLFEVKVFARIAGTGGVFIGGDLTSAGGDLYQGEISAELVTAAGVEYYIRAIDASPAYNTAQVPTDGPDAPYFFSVSATDSAGPTITHSPITGPRPAGVAIDLHALIDDASGVASASLFVETGTGWVERAMAEVPDQPIVFTGQITAAEVLAPQVRYYLKAEDASEAANVSMLPAGGADDPFVFEVYSPDEQGPVIVHTPVADGQLAGVEVQIDATVSDASGVAEVMFYFRTAGAGVFIGGPMSITDGQSYSGSIPGTLVEEPGIDYYIEAVDDSDEQNRSVHPDGAPAELHSFTVIASGEDLQGPEIQHTPIADGVPAGADVAVEAQVTDSSGVASVALFYRISGQSAFSQLAMELDSGQTYTASIPGQMVTAQGVDYYIQATDSAPAANAASHPEGAPAELHSFVPSEGEAPGEGGCGCAAAGRTGLSLLGLLLGLALWRRTRRR
ncbi:MAG: right-handed parallel beta-helix repeat-containing protein [Deltaproteobacteria bacterium]|nr:right-handed parallel beta-helix repeat-containing protein [Deltaproteobacteria bacterium]